MGSISHNAPQRFAEQLRSYLWAQIEHEADSSGRWLEKKTDGARSREYWRKVTSGVQAMTTNDVEVIAVAVFEQSPYDFIRAARAWTAPAGELVEGRFRISDVPASEETPLPRVAKKASRDPGGDEGDF